MAFILEFAYATHQKTIPNFLVSILRRFEIESSLTHENGRIVCSMREDHPRLQEALETMQTVLPSSVFIRESSHRFEEGTPQQVLEFFDSLPLGLGVCPQCQKEMFDPSSRRYYYPFTSCKSCGGQYAFFDHYPYVRENTQLRSVQPCTECEKELVSNPFREHYPQIGCHGCGIAADYAAEGENHRAQDASGYKALFEKAAATIAQGRRVRIKTTMGYRMFYPIAQFRAESILLIVNPSRITNLVALIDEELQALISIEKPILHVAVADETLKASVGGSVDTQIPDEGFTVLLGRELKNLGIDAVGYEYTDESGECEASVEFDLPVHVQSPMRLFLNKEVRFVAQGERGSFPAYVSPVIDVASFGHGLAAIVEDNRMIVDQVGRFEGTKTFKVNALKDEELSFTHGNLHRIDQDIASCMAVLHENGLRHSSSVCAYFDETITFLYAKNGHITRVVPSEPFNGNGLIGRISALREGSDRLVENLKNRHADLYAVIERIESESSDLFEAAAMIIGLDRPGQNALIREALRFVGKGGLQVDTKLKDNRFDHVAFLASIISYKIADVSSPLLCYSIFESLGDYFSDILTELKNRSKADNIVLCGSGFANQSLYSRVARNLKNTPPILSRSFPIGRENGVLGGIYL